MMLTLTGRGWGFLSLAILLWIGSRSVGLRDVWSFGILIGAFVVVSGGAAATAACARLSATLTPSLPSPTLGDTVAVKTRFSHRLPWPVHVMARWRFGPEPEILTREVDIPAGDGCSVEVPWVPPRRGVNGFRLDSLTILGPLGLARLRLKRKEAGHLLVHPPILPQVPAPFGEYLNGTDSPRTANVSAHNTGEPAGALRDYRDGDAMREVHWKQSARQGQLLVNLPDTEQLPEQSLWLETSPDAYPDDDSFELAVATAATIGSDLLNMADVLEFNNHHRVHSESELLRLLARVDRGTASEDAGGEEAGSRGAGTIVTATVTPELHRSLTRMGEPSSGVLYVQEGSPDGGHQEVATASDWHIVTVPGEGMPRIAPPHATADSEPAPATRIQILLGSVAVFGLWMLAMWSFTGVLEPGGWLPKAAALAAILIFGAAALRALRPTLRPSAALTSLFVGLAAAAWWSYDAGRLEGWWNNHRFLFEAIGQEVYFGSPPMEVGGAMEDLVLFLFLLGIVVSTLFLIGVDCFVLSAVMPAIAMLVPVTVLSESLPAPMLAGAALLTALLVFAGSPRRNLGAVVAALTALALAAATVAWAPASTDRVWNQANVRSPVSSTVPDVTVALGQDLRERSDVVAFTYEGASGPMRFPLATLSEFTQGRWLPQDQINAGGTDVRTARTPGTLTPEVLGSPETIGPEQMGATQPVTITIEGLVSEWLPMPHSPILVDGVSENFDPADWIWMEESNTARKESGGTRRGDEYQVYAMTLEPEILEVLSDGALSTYPNPDSAPEHLQPYLELPGTIPAAISETAEDVTAGAEGSVEIATALQEYFRSGEFGYDEEAPYEPGMDSGDPYAVMEALLEQKTGYCVHYASTNAVMARSLGIPSRVAVGYAPFSSTGASTQVRGGELHAWPEIFVEEAGWIPFEPTPGGPGGASPTQDQTAPTEESTTESAAPTDTATSDSSPTQTQQQDASHDPPTQTPETDAPAWQRFAPWVIVAALLALAIPAMARAARTIGRRNRSATHAWAEVEETAVDLGLDASDLRARTGEAVIEHLVATRMLINPDAIAAARAILAAADKEQYGAPGDTAAPDRPAPHPDNLRTVLAELRRQSSRRLRVSARLWPRSLVHRGARIS
ncbi:MAG: transglutaminaseTgpA domain-containing protein [Ancrocorticia sp.]|uniref:transglutaminaseTgpA domain-containing protein n=1 Tax=Ancrocorticia sp. TaxID=2593684 RepID=UPI003F935855